MASSFGVGCCVVSVLHAARTYDHSAIRSHSNPHRNLDTNARTHFVANVDTSSYANIPTYCYFTANASTTAVLNAHGHPNQDSNAHIYPDPNTFA